MSRFDLSTTLCRLCSILVLTTLFSAALLLFFDAGASIRESQQHMCEAILKKAQKEFDVGEYNGCINHVEWILENINKCSTRTPLSEIVIEALKLKTNALGELGNYSAIDSLLSDRDLLRYKYDLPETGVHAMMLNAANMFMRKRRYLQARDLYEAVVKETSTLSLQNFITQQMSRIETVQVGNITGRVIADGEQLSGATIVIYNGFFEVSVALGVDGIFDIPIFEISNGSRIYVVVCKDGFSSAVELIQWNSRSAHQMGTIELQELNCADAFGCGEIIVLCFVAHQGGYENPVYGILRPVTGCQVTAISPLERRQLNDEGNGVYRCEILPGTFQMDVCHITTMEVKVSRCKLTLVPVSFGTVFVD